MNTQKSFVSGLQQAAQDNPLAAGLIGLGALWLLSGRLKTIASLREAGVQAAGMSRAAVDKASRVGDHATESGEAATSRLDEAMSSAGDGAKRSAAPLTDRVGDAAAATASAAQDAAGQTTQRFTGAMRGAAQSLYAKSQGTYSQLQDLLEDQPLAIGIIGLGLGLAVAASFPLTSTEAERLRPVADTLKHRLDEGVDVVKERTARAAEAARGEAKRQGLDPQTIGDQLRDKATAFSDAMRESAREHTS
jgi:hypothetical protein